MIPVNVLASSFERLYSFFNTLYSDNKSHMDQSYIDKLTIPVAQFKSYEKENLNSDGIKFGYKFPITMYNSVKSVYEPLGGSSYPVELGYLLICPDESINYSRFGLNMYSTDFASKVYNDVFDHFPQFGISRSVVVRNNPDVIMMDLVAEDIKYYKKFIYDVFRSIINLLDPNCAEEKVRILGNILTDTFITIMLINQDVPYPLSKYINNSTGFDEYVEIFRAGRKPNEQHTVNFIVNAYNNAQE